MNMTIAEITMDPKTKRIANMVLFRKDHRFKCQRCAIFCCRLGGPKINNKDLQRLKQAGYDAKNFVKNVKKENVNKGFLKEKEDGSCVFLEYSDKSKKYACLIYNFRPSVCRLYPFEFTLTSPNVGILRVIPCCNGLNVLDGELVNQKFVEKNLLEAIIDSL